MDDTIAAVSTPLGEGAISIIRLSGPEARSILESIFVPRRQGTLLPYRLRLGWVVDTESGRRLDEVLATWMPAGGSYTAEEMAEIDCHGGITAVRSVLGLVLRQGARLAKPGEFTLRAFLNGRLSLTEAEAVLDIIRAPGVAGLESAVRQLGGELARLAQELYAGLKGLVAELEASIDFPDEVGEVDPARMDAELVEMERTLSGLLAEAEQGRVMREGLRIVLVGKPNAGKSSLLNALLGEERAIVTPVPGTTRDVLEEAADWLGLPVRLYDTAGLGEPRDASEEVAVRRARETVEQADVILLVVDGSSDTRDGREMANEFGQRNLIVVINKVDLINEGTLRARASDFQPWPVVATSAKEGRGLEALQERVIDLVAQKGIRPGVSALVTRERQRRLLEQSLLAIKEARVGLRERVPEDCLAISLHEGLEAVGELLGYNVREEVLEEMFAEFCIGK